MFDAKFLSRIYNGLPRDEYAEKDVSAEKGVFAKKDVSDEDNLGDHWPIHDPTIKWKLMRPVLGEKYESPEQLKRALMRRIGNVHLGDSCMERLQKMRDKHAKWNDGICPNIRKKLEKYKDLHRHWNVILSGASRFEVRNDYEGFKVDERSRTCSCRGWQLSGIPCEYGIAAIYFLHKDPENYVSDWYNKDVFVNAYNHYIEGMNGMDQWPTTDYQSPYLLLACPSKPKRTASVGQVSATGDIVSASVRKVTIAGEIISASGGNVIASGGIMTAKGGNVTARGGKVSARGGKVIARGGIVMS
ncbi:multidrug resistance-associated protein 5, partial [Tanacetum coccineum]